MAFASGPAPSTHPGDDDPTEENGQRLKLPGQHASQDRSHLKEFSLNGLHLELESSRLEQSAFMRDGISPATLGTVASPVDGFTPFNTTDQLGPSQFAPLGMKVMNLP